MKKFKGWLSSVALGMLMAVGLSLPAQDSPFESPFSSPPNETPVATPVETPQAVDPFMDPSMDPFAQSDEPEAPNPFDQPAEETGPSPFDAPPPSAPPEATDPFRRPPATSAPAPEAPLAPPSDIPLASTAAVREAQEIRGLYVQAAGRGYQTISQLEELLRDARAGRFTRIYAEVRTPDGVTYGSAIEDSLPTISPLFPNPVRDLNRRLGQEMRIIAVVNVLPAFRAASGSRPPARNPLGRFPEFMSFSVTGQHVARDNFMHLDPGNPLVMRYLASVIAEIDREVQPDGYLLVGMRYPGSEWGYSKAAVEEFRSAVGGEGPPAPDDPVWSAWRREQMTRLMQTLRGTIHGLNPDARVSVLVETEGGAPPENWDQWQNSKTYSEYMQDWISWTRSGIVDEVVFEVHERTAPQGNHLRDWVQFAGNNTDRARPIMSIAGYLNFANGLIRQLDLARTRGVGTMLYHYADPVRDPSRGFFNSLPNVFYKLRMGSKVPGARIDGPQETREFARMNNPPPAVRQTESGEITTLPEAPMGSPDDLVFATPVPLVTRTPTPVYVPDEIARKITLRSGQTVEAVVLELTPTTITFKEEARSPLIISRSAIQDIEPPL